MLSSSFLFLLFLPFVYSDVCPSGYTKSEDWEGGDCYKLKSFYDSFAGIYIPKSFDEAEAACNSDGGGLLASILSEKENNFIFSKLTGDCSLLWKNIGLRCKGTDCKWDDGSPMTYRNFQGDGPRDDGMLRCYAGGPNNYWTQQDCGKQPEDCWVCKVKARTIYCVDGETEYDGGCVSVYSPPHDQKTAEPTCPNGGRPVSIHSSTENSFYKNIALNAGVNGSIFIGGSFSRGVYQWHDNSIATYQPWANGFPNTIIGLCAQMLLDSKFGSQGQWTNIACGTNQPVFCIRDFGTPITDVPEPKAPAQCPPVKYYGFSGSIYSPNYPVSIPGEQTCEYVILTEDDWKASVRFRTYDCQSGTSLSLFNGLNSTEPFLTFTSDSPVLDQLYISSSFAMKIVFTANGTSTVGTGWEAEYCGYHDDYCTR